LAIGIDDKKLFTSPVVLVGAVSPLNIARAPNIQTNPASNTASRIPFLIAFLLEERDLEGMIWQALFICQKINF